MNIQISNTLIAVYIWLLILIALTVSTAAFVHYVTVEQEFIGFSYTALYVHDSTNSKIKLIVRTGQSSHIVLPKSTCTKVEGAADTDVVCKDNITTLTSAVVDYGLIPVSDSPSK